LYSGQKTQRGYQMNKGAATVFASYVIWGFFPIFWHQLTELNAVYTLATRVVWTLVFTAIMLAGGKNLRQVKALLSDRKSVLYLGICGALICTNWGVYIYAVNAERILDTSLAYYLSPVLSILLGYLLFHEKLTPLKWGAVALAFTSVLVPVIQSRTIPWLCLVMASSFSLYGAMKKRAKAMGNASLFMEMLPALPIALAFIAFTEISGKGIANNLPAWKYLLIPLTGAVTAVPLLLFSKGIKTVPYTLTGILMYISPTLQFLVGVFVYGEPFTPMNALTFALVWVALVLYFISDMRQRRREKAEGIAQAAVAASGAVQ
jgi:chloramphenicol-sensitive protein RarD